jgi:hypothetical protein
MARSQQRKALMLLTGVWLAWMVWYLALGRSEAVVQIVDDTGAPIAGAEVLVGEEVVGVTDSSGAVNVSWTGGSPNFDVAAAGFRPTWFLPRSPATTVELEPFVLSGIVVDPDDRPVAGVMVRSGSALAESGAGGRFTVRGGQPGRVVAWMPAWEEGAWDWDGSPGAIEIELRPFVVKAMHIGGEVAGDPVRWAELLATHRRSELNAIMLDLKDEAGLVFYETEVELARQTGAIFPEYDLIDLARAVHAEDLYLIGRIVAFQDPVTATGRPDLAVTVNGAVYSKRGQSFLDPTDQEARRYALDLAVEACRSGVDEIQFDYIRFPDGFPVEAVFDGPSDQEGRIETIRSFLAEARSLLRPLGCAVAADVFGFTTSAADDGGIGQKWDVVAAELDVISPMLYPSHYGAGWYSFDDPAAYPAEVVERALEDGLARLESSTVVRPWLQDFAYDATQVRGQIDVAERFGLGWMLWNAASNVTEEALR